jgi:phosphohistidine phosphatase
VAGVNRLAVLRHAKATHEPGYSDINRPLTRRGQRDAAAVGRFLRTKGIVPDIVLCSSSSRTSETWDYLAAAQVTATGTASARATGPTGARTASARATGAAGAATTGIVAAPGEVSYDERIYDAGMEDLFEIIRATPATVGTLMIIGHNPAVHELVRALTGDREIDFPTCALAVIELAGGWADTSMQGGSLATFWTPKGGTR